MISTMYTRQTQKSRISIQQTQTTRPRGGHLPDICRTLAGHLPDTRRTLAGHFGHLPYTGPLDPFLVSLEHLGAWPWTLGDSFTKNALQMHWKWKPKWRYFLWYFQFSWKVAFRVWIEPARSDCCFALLFSAFGLPFWGHDFSIDFLRLLGSPRDTILEVGGNSGTP